VPHLGGGKMKITQNDALLVLDVQNDFCPGGSLAVPNGDRVIAVIHRLAPHFEHIILTQDWHPAGHSSFASSHPGKLPFETIELDYGTQVLWPDHCIQGSHGAELHPLLNLTQAELILRKGFRPQIDSYSALFENDRTTPTGLASYLRERNLSRIFCAGLAYDYCVGYSALDIKNAKMEAIVIRDACEAIDQNGSVSHIEQEFAHAGVILTDSEALLS
jgi:nicotinamidase/pyrazinamidase